MAAYVGVAAGNATEAYRIAGYAGTGSGARVNASKLLTSTNVAAAIAERREAKELALVMGGDEAMQRLSVIGRADIGNVLAPDDPINKLPAEVRATIKSVKPGRYGRTLELHDSMKAIELCAKAGGKLKEIVQVERKMEDILAEVNALDAARRAASA